MPGANGRVADSSRELVSHADKKSRTADMLLPHLLGSLEAWRRFRDAGDDPQGAPHGHRDGVVQVEEERANDRIVNLG